MAESYLESISGTCDSLVCSICRIELRNSINPCQLPCGHFACQECLKSFVDSNYPNKTECVVCGQKVDLSKIDELPKAAGGIVTHGVFCGWPQCYAEAEVFCRHCNINLCGTHVKEEQDTLHTKGELIHYHVPIELYSKDYERHMCKTHPECQVKKVCENCKRIFCNNCDWKELCNTGSQHIMVDFKRIAEEYRAKAVEINDLLGLLSNDCEIAEKQLSNEGQENDKLVESQITEIEAAYEKGLKALEAQRESKLQAVRETADVFNKETKDKVARLDSARKRLDEMRADIGRIFVRYCLDSQVTEQYMEKENGVAELLSLIDCESKQYGLRIKVPILPSIQQQSNIQLEKESNFRAKLADLVCLPNGDIVCGCYGEGKLYLCNEQLKKVDEIVLNAECRSVQMYVDSDLILVSVYQRDEGKIALRLYSKKLELVRTLHDYVDIGGFAHVAVSANFVVSLESGKSVLIYNKVGEYLSGPVVLSLKNPNFPRGLCISPCEKYVIVSDYKNGTVSSYKLDGELRWTCPGLEYPTGIAISKDGTIFCTNIDGKIIYRIRLTDGQLLQSLVSPLLGRKDRLVSGLSIDKEEKNLYLACGQGSCIVKFRI